MENCIFCKIIKGEIPCTKLYEDDNMVIIKDINPETDKHYLLLPKQHYSDICQMTAEQSVTLGECLKRLGEIANDIGLQNGFRLISNKGDDARQSVGHLHIHILGGELLPNNLVGKE